MKKSENEVLQLNWFQSNLPGPIDEDSDPDNCIKYGDHNAAYVDICYSRYDDIFVALHENNCVTVVKSEEIRKAISEAKNGEAPEIPWKSNLIVYFDDELEALEEPFQASRIACKDDLYIATPVKGNKFKITGNPYCWEEDSIEVPAPKNTRWVSIASNKIERDTHRRCFVAVGYYPGSRTDDYVVYTVASYNGYDWFKLPADNICHMYPREVMYVGGAWCLVGDAKAYYKWDESRNMWFVAAWLGDEYGFQAACTNGKMTAMTKMDDVRYYVGADYIDLMSTSHGLPYWWANLSANDDHFLATGPTSVCGIIDEGEWITCSMLKTSDVSYWGRSAFGGGFWVVVSPKFEEHVAAILDIANDPNYQEVE